ncbi:MAG: MFS transporter [Phycisphaerales bacterium]
MPSQRSALAPYLDRRIAALALIGFGSGLPLALTSDTLQAWLRGAKFDLATIGFLSLVGLPSALQVLWAPLVDRYAPSFSPRGPLRFLAPFGRRRAWMLLTQVALVAAIAQLGFAGPRDATSPLLPVAFFATLVALLSATQDIAANAYRADVLEERSRGAGAAVFVTGYRLAMIASGAGVLALSEVVPWPAAYAIAAAMMAIGLAGTLIAPEPPDAHAAPASLAEAVIEPSRAFFGRPIGWLILLFVLVFKLPDYLAGRMTLVFLLDCGFSKGEIATVRQAFGIAMTIVGALVGGGVVARLGTARALMLFGVLQVASNVGFLWLAAAPAVGPSLDLAAPPAPSGLPPMTKLVVVIAVENFCAGLVAAGFVAFLMACCQRRFSATQYALLSSMMLLGSTAAGSISGAMAEWLGWPRFFIATIVAGAPGLAMVPFAGEMLRRLHATDVVARE